MDKQSNNPDLWNDPNNARAILQKKSALEKSLTELRELESEYTNLRDLYAMAPDDNEIISAIEKLADVAHHAKLITLFNGPADNDGAFLFIQPPNI